MPLTAILAEDGLVAVEGAMQSALTAVASAQATRHSMNNQGNAKAHVTLIMNAHTKDRFELLTSEAGLQAIAQSMSASSGVRMDVLQAALLVGMHIAKSVVYGDDGTALESGVAEGQEFVNPLAVSSSLHSTKASGVVSSGVVVSGVSRSAGAQVSTASVQRISSTARTLTALSMEDKMVVLHAAMCAAVNTAKLSIVDTEDPVDIETLARNALRAARFATAAIAAESAVSRETRKRALNSNPITFLRYMHASLMNACTCGGRQTSTNQENVVHVPGTATSHMPHMLSKQSNAVHSRQSKEPIERKSSSLERNSLIGVANTISSRTVSKQGRDSFVRFTAMKVGAGMYRTNTIKKLAQAS